MKLHLMTLLTFYSFLTLAQERPKELAGFDPKTDIIADNYEAGAFLLYDCQEGHWTCVTEPYFETCKVQRAADKEKNKEIYSCAPVGEFPTKKSCFQRQLFLTTHNVSHDFCSKEVVKKFLE